MLTESLVIGPLCILLFTGIINWKITGIITFSFYWLPKCFFVKSLNYAYPEVVTHSNKNNNQIALTFDDVPYYGTNNLKKIVASLDEYNMKGTFFVISDYVSDSETKKILIEMVKNGHQLANHGKTNSMHLTLGHNVLKNEITECDHVIKEIYLMANKELPKKMFYRPGCGAFNQRVIDLAKSYDYTLALGSVYPNDPMVRSSLVNYYYIITHLEQNDVVIMHDRSWTPDMLDMLLKYMNKKSYRSVTLDEFI